MTDTTPTPATGFYGLGIAPKLLAALDALKFTVPTPIQARAIPAAAEGKDMVGIAQTGTGKTIAFAIPMIQQLAARDGKGLVLVPTRELAMQVAEVVRLFAPLMGMNAAIIIGGESSGRQVQELRKNPRIIIATPGRLIDHINQRNVNLGGVRVLVLDEADRMFDMGFAPQIKKIIAALPRDRQTMLFSATMPDAIMKLASAHMKLPVRIEVARSGTVVDKVEQELFIVDRGDKSALLAKLLDKYWGSVLLFVRTKHSAKKIARAIREMPHNAAEIHSNRSLAQRREALEGFKSGKYRVLVATDIAARGIDVTGIELVINYDLPDEEENYVHRIGRTGRAGQPGRAITFASPDQRKDVRSIERLIRMPLLVSTFPDISAAEFGGPEGPSQPGEKRRPGEQHHQRPASPARQQPRPPERQDRGPASPGQQRPGQEHGTQDRPAHGRPRRDFQRQDRPGQGGGRRDYRRQDRPGGFSPRRQDTAGGAPRPASGRAPMRRDEGSRARGNSRRTGPDGYGARPGQHGGIVSPSPYFDEPRRRPSARQGRPDANPGAGNKPPAAGNWFSRFLKKSKKDYKNE